MVREARTQELLHIGKSNGGKVQLFCCAVLRDEKVGVADKIPLIGIDYFIVIPACSGKIIGDALLRILNALSENLIDRKGSLIHIFRNGCVVIEDRLPNCSGRSAARQAPEGKPRQGLELHGIAPHPTGSAPCRWSEWRRSHGRHTRRRGSE